MAAVTWAVGMQILAVSLVAVISLVSGLGLFRVLNDGHAGPAIPGLRLSACLVTLGALFQAGFALGLWRGGPWYWMVATGLLGLLPAVATILLLTCWRRVSEPLSPRHLRDANQALRQEIEVLQRQAAAHARGQKMDALARLSGDVSHYVNNAMQVMGGAMALLAPRVADDSKAQDLIAMSLGAVDRGMRLTSQLLVFAQQPSESPCLLDVPAFLDIVRAETAARLRPGIGFTLDEWSGQPRLPLLVDRGEVMQALTNLVANAQDAIGTTGRLAIGLASYYARDRDDLDDGYYLRLTVTDDGKGLAPQVADQAIDPFVSTKPIGLAAGLGLSVVYGIARRGGGVVTLEANSGESTPGQGTRASLYLRLAMVEADMDLAPDRALASEIGDVRDGFDGLRVMLVEDEPETRAIVAMTLESLGCIVVQADSAETALALVEAGIESGVPDLFILDYTMPGMNGAQLAYALRARDTTCRIAFLTGFADRVAIEAVLGRDVVLVYKPASRPQLVRAIADAVA